MRREGEIAFSCQFDDMFIPMGCGKKKGAEERRLSLCDRQTGLYQRTVAMLELAA